MKITIEHPDKAPIVFEDVQEYCLFGIRGKLNYQDFSAWQGNYKHLMEKTLTGYTDLKDLYRKERDGNTS